MAPAYAGFYAFNPIILISYAAEGHFDSLMVAALIWALVAHGAGRFKWAVALASVATGVKWIALPLIPFFAVLTVASGKKRSRVGLPPCAEPQSLNLANTSMLRSSSCAKATADVSSYAGHALGGKPSQLRQSGYSTRKGSRNFSHLLRLFAATNPTSKINMQWHCCKLRHYVLAAAISVAVLLLPTFFFWETLPELLQGLFQFGSTRSFNGPIYECPLWIGLPRVFCSILVAVCFGGIVIWRWLNRERSSVDGHIRWILGALIVLSPTVHLWYLAWILPFVCLRPSMPWLTFSLTGGAYFYVWLNAAQGDWILHPWQMWIFWMPFGLACLYELWSTRGRVVFPLNRFALVMRLVTRYRKARLQSRATATALSEEMYQEYYNTRK